MSGYLVNFIVYTVAMIGIIFLALFVYKKCSYSGNTKSKFLNVEDCINLAPRKSIYVVRAGSERFLVASDAERTSLIAKLDEQQSFGEKFSGSQQISQRKQSVDDLPNIVDFHKELGSQNKKVFKNIINNL